MAQYAILIFDNPAAGGYTSEQQAASKRHADDLVDSGAMIAAYALLGVLVTAGQGPKSTQMTS